MLYAVAHDFITNDANVHHRIAMTYCTEKNEDISM